LNIESNPDTWLNNKIGGSYMTIITKATYQGIARAAIEPSFDDDDEYIELVKETARAFENLDLNARLAVEAGYIFSRKVPREERQDLFQELIAAILDSGTENAAFAYTIARRDWQNWYSQYKLHSQFYQGYLSETLTNSDGEETELAELLVGEVEFENKQIDKLDSQTLWSQIPAEIQVLITKRLEGKPLGAPRRRKAGQPKNSGTLNGTERQRLNRWVKTEGHKLLIN
jgi:DNA-directed RNA polymerase specialized sigma24 family protein